MANWKLIFSALFLIVTACGEVTTNTAAPTPSNTDPRGGATPPPSSDPNHPTGNTVVVLGANYTDPIGSIGTISLNSPRTPTKNIQPTHSDAVVRSFANKLYVVNRLGADNIQVVDPGQGFAVAKQFSVGQGTNPQDIIVTQPTKGYVTLYQPEDNRNSSLTVDDLLVVNPQSGEILKTIDLNPYTTDDGERFARTSSMVIVEDRIFVAVQDMPKNLSLPPNQPGKIVVIDTKTDTVIGSLILSGRNPIAMDYSPKTGLIYLSNADFFDLKSAHGGIEAVDPKTMQSKGIVIDDLALGGSPGDIEVGGSRSKGYLTVGISDPATKSFSTKVVSFDLDPTAPPNLTDVYRGTTYIQALSVDKDDNLLVGDRDPRVNGILFIDTKTNKVIDGPINTGPAPSSMTFIERTSISSSTSSSASPSPPPSPPPSPAKEAAPCKKADSYASKVVSFKKGENGGSNEDKLPGVVLGPPHGAGLFSGNTTDIISLGRGGEIVLGFDRCLIVDGKGPDFTVFENAFQIAGTDDAFAEPGFVGVSDNGINFAEFPCSATEKPYKGCAGIRPVLANPDLNSIDPLDPSASGGDPFDLADIGLKSVRFIRIRDAGVPIGPVGPGTAGFDLDAIAIVNGVVP